MPNYVPTWDDLQKKSFQADCDWVDMAFLEPQAFPCPHCNRKLRKLNIGYICDRCLSVFAETMTAKENGVAEIIETHERVVVGITDYPVFATVFTQGESNGKEADEEDANGQDAEGQGQGLLTS